MNPPIIRPSRLWYMVAGVLLLATVGSIGFGIVGLIALDLRIQHFQRVTVPGRATITLFEPGRYVLYAEGPDASDLRVRAEFPAVLKAGGGATIPIDRYPSGPSYDIGNHRGRAVGSFVVAERGNYVLAVAGPVQPGVTGVAVGRDIRRGVAVPTALILVPMFTLGPAALITVIVTAVRRRNAARRARPATPWFTVTAAPWPVPAGWHPDPAGRHEYRYWDGQGWTDQVWDRGTPGTDPPT